MSSSCVPPKGSSVSHDPNPDSANDQNNGNDSDSECGSLCTCTSSSSMTSIAISVDAPTQPHEGNAQSEDSSYTQSRQPQQQQPVPVTVLPSTGTPTATTATQPLDSNGSPYFVVFVPPTMLPRRGNNCGNCQRGGDVHPAMKASLFTALELFPWIAGIIFIYYAFYLWGLGPGFSAFLLLVGGHAFVRFLRAGGQTICKVPRLTRVPQNSTSNEATANDEDEEDNRNHQERSRGEESPPRHPRNESPPPYETAVTKPPPYDLYHHLTPTQPRNQLYSTDKSSMDDNFLTVPQLSYKKEHFEAEEEDDDVFLPSYQDALRLSFRSEKSIEAEIAAINNDQT